MNPVSPEEISELRLKMVKVEFYAKSDGSYLARLREDPIAVLREEGFEDPVANEIAQQLRGDYGDESSASAPHCPKCDPWSCIVTGCCLFTLVEPTDVEA